MVCRDKYVAHRTARSASSGKSFDGVMAPVFFLKDICMCRRLPSYHTPLHWLWATDFCINPSGPGSKPQDSGCSHPKMHRIIWRCWVTNHLVGIPQPIQGDFPILVSDLAHPRLAPSTAQNSLQRFSMFHALLAPCICRYLIPYMFLNCTVRYSKHISC